MRRRRRGGVVSNPEFLPRAQRSRISASRTDRIGPRTHAPTKSSRNIPAALSQQGLCWSHRGGRAGYQICGQCLFGAKITFITKSPILEAVHAASDVAREWPRGRTARIPTRGTRLCGSCFQGHAGAAKNAEDHQALAIVEALRSKRARNGRGPQGDQRNGRRSAREDVALLGLTFNPIRHCAMRPRSRSTALEDAARLCAATIRRMEQARPS